MVEPLFDAEQALLLRLEELRLQFNRDLFLGIFDLELHYAWYAPGTFYARHVDQPFARLFQLIRHAIERAHGGNR